MTLNNYQCHHQRYFCLIIVVVVVALTNSIVSTTSNEISSSDEYCTNIYEIFDGDSCENIVLAFQISMDELIELNPELDCGNITIGDIICLPASLNMTNMIISNNSSSELNDTVAASAKAGVCAQYYTTLSDDSCDIIAQAFQTTVTTLVELNPGLKCAELHPDQILCVPLLFSTTSTPSQCKLFYLVYEDDTCETIADAYKITKSLLVKLNPSLDCNRMPILEKICVSGGEPSHVRSCDNKYTVYPGDSCANIAHAFKITLSQLMELNPGLNCDDIPVGQVVFIPCDVLPEPAKLEQSQPQPEPQAPQYTDSCRSFYTISEGDECAMIAAEFQINVEFLLLLNPSLDCSRRLPIGLRICIPPIHFNTPYVTAEPTFYDFPTSTATTTTSTIISKKDFHETYQTSDFFTQHPGYTPVIEPEYHQEHYVSTSQPETTIDNSNQIIELTTNKTSQLDALPYVDYQPILPQNEEIELLTTSGVNQELMPNNSSQYEAQLNQTHHRDDISKGFYVPTTTTETIQYQAPYFPPSQYQPPQLNPVEPQQPFSSLEPLIIVVTEATDLNTMQPETQQTNSFVSYEPLGVAALPQQEQQEPMYPPPPPLLPLNPPFPPQYQEYHPEQPVYHNSDYQMHPQSVQQPEYHANENQSYVNQPPPQQQQQQQQQPIVQGKQESSYSQFSNNYQTPPTTTTTTVMPQSTLAPSLSCEYLYTINIDDSCESIANAFKITTDTLLELNPGLACHYLSIGQRICLPNLRPNSESDSNGSKGYSNSNPDQQQVFTTISNTPSCKSYYTVCEGDTCQSISAAYHITTALLFYLNPNLNCDSLTLGQKVCIPAVSYFMYPVSKCENYFTVYEGDSCEYVAQGFRITIAALIQLNPGINCERLPVGTKICVPSADSYPNTPPCENYHLVSPGDTCFKIAEANGISIKKLYAINPGLNCYGLEVGRRVCVPSITYQTATISYEPAQKLMYKPTVLPYKCICYYQIVPGDTCEIIAKVYKTTIEELQALNPGLNCIYVQYGRQICVNSGEYTTYSQCRISYSVKEGDSCYTVSLKYGIDLNRITTKYDCNNLRLGQNICI